jgi:Cd2+/Zn2+-exporting ATPase
MQKFDEGVGHLKEASYNVAGEILRKIMTFTALQGRGIQGFIVNVRFRLSNHRLVEESNASTPDSQGTLDTLERQGKTAVVLMRKHMAVGTFAFVDKVRPESAEAVRQLKPLGIRPVMLTGDNRHMAEAIAKQVGVEDVRSELLPGKSSWPSRSCGLKASWSAWWATV